MVDDHEGGVVELDELDEFIALSRADEQLSVGQFPVLGHDAADLRPGGLGQRREFLDPRIEVHLVIGEMDGNQDGSLPGNLQMFTMLLIHWLACISNC